ncbi:zinc-dependent metalloprotease [Chitinophaga caseinilytica]|uniref:zinc-dependent metalloprotease n=1 Tax=Chitinophaga caseinilytica TaxID=2267521 RepID=UPI003C2E5545
MNIRSIMLAGALLAVAAQGRAQTIPIPIPAEFIPGEVKDTTKKPAAPAADPRNTIKPFGEVISKEYSTRSGLFTVHQNRDTFYFEIPQTLLGRDIQAINRLVKGPGGANIYSGEEIGHQTVRFVKNDADSTIRLMYISVMGMADKDQQIYKSVEASYYNAVAAVFPIKAYGKDGKSFVIDAGAYIKNAIGLFNDVNDQYNSKVVDKNTFKDILVESVKAYPINMEFRISKNGNAKGNSDFGIPANAPATVVTNTSFILLPEQPMVQRGLDKRVGYLADYAFYFADNQQRTEKRNFVHRWRLEPKPEDMAKYKRGELVEPAKPIVIYIDPATPKQWRKYLIAGVNDWQKAFEQAGFKNAIVGKEWPESDSIDMDDARFSFIRYLPSDIPNAYGPNIHDPRSGEILQTHIGWYHNIMRLLRNWYFIQSAVNDPQARKPRFDDKLMGELVRFVSSHEVGHTLGLAHNFGSSSRTPVDSMRSRKYLARHGHTASIMDYARFNYVAQPEDNIPQELLFPKIGEYDRWAIEWGYRFNGAKTFEEDKKLMDALTTQRLAQNPLLYFGDGEKFSFDPRNQREDLGDNPAKAGNYGIENLKRLLKNLPEWTKEEGGQFESLEELYAELKGQFTRYLSHNVAYIGSKTWTPRSERAQGEVLAPVSKALQLEILSFFDKQVFTPPTWLLDPAVTTMINPPAYPDFVEDIQVKTLNSLLDVSILTRLLSLRNQFGDKALQPEEYLTSLHNMIWKELATGNITSHYRRNLQKSYVGALGTIIMGTSADFTENDAFSLVRMDLLDLQKEIEAAIPKSTDRFSKIHLEDLHQRIRDTFEAGGKKK